MSVTTPATSAPKTFFQAWRINGFKEPLILRAWDTKGCPMSFDQETWEKVAAEFQSTFADEGFKKASLNSISLVFKDVDPEHPRVTYELVYANGETSSQPFDQSLAKKTFDSLNEKIGKCAEKNHLYTSSSSPTTLSPLGGALPPPVTSPSSSAATPSPSATTASPTTSSKAPSIGPTTYQGTKAQGSIEGGELACTAHAGAWVRDALLNTNDISLHPTPEKLDAILTKGKDIYKATREGIVAKAQEAIRVHQSFLADLQDPSRLTAEIAKLETTAHRSAAEDTQLNNLRSWQAIALDPNPARKNTLEANCANIIKNHQLIINENASPSHYLNAGELYGSSQLNPLIMLDDKGISLAITDGGSVAGLTSTQTTDPAVFFQDLLHKFKTQIAKGEKTGAILTAGGSSYGFTIDPTKNMEIQFYDSHIGQLLVFNTEEAERNFVAFIAAKIGITHPLPTIYSFKAPASAVARSSDAPSSPSMSGAGSEGDDAEDDSDDDDEYVDPEEFTGPVPPASASSPATSSSLPHTGGEELD